MTPEQLADLIERLEKADAELMKMVRTETSRLGFDSLRVEGKAEGVRLALSYIREYPKIEPYPPKPHPFTREGDKGGVMADSCGECGYARWAIFHVHPKT